MPRSLSTAVAYVCAAALSLMLFSPAEAYVQNGTTWPSYSVCYRVDGTAAAYAEHVHAAADAWTSASTGGFEFVHDPDCVTGVWLGGLIDGPGPNHGYTWLNGMSFSGPNGPEGQVLLTDALTIIEEYPGGDPHGTLSGGALRNDEPWDPLDCPALTPDLAGYCSASNPLCVQIGGKWHYASPMTQAVALHEFGHWLWLGEDWQGASAMAPVPVCQYLALTQDDIDGLNFLYP